jgi:hypothetical protein
MTQASSRNTAEGRVKRISRGPGQTKLTRKTGSDKQPGSPDPLNGLHASLATIPNPNTDNPKQHDTTLEHSELNRFKELPKEVGVMLITAGIVGLILPGPGTPAIIAGGLALWPNAFGKLDSWLGRRYPEIHRLGMRQIGRFLDDLEKRYPYSSQG